MTIYRFFGLLLLLLASTWTALINGQPLFGVDTTAYVRAPDFAVVYLLGPKFATSWTQKRTLEGSQQRQLDNVRDARVVGGDVSLNSPFDRSVMAGRSIYYGALLYLGHILSDFWLVIFTQAAIFLYLSYTLLITCLRISFVAFACVTIITLVVTPLSFFICTLMPDVFAGFLILSAVILTGFWDSLEYRDRVILSLIVLYSALTHTSHLLLLFLLTSAVAVTFIFIRRKTRPYRSIRSSFIVLLALSLLGVFGELAFSYGVRLTIGAYPVRPPFLMGRLIADGPGYDFLRKYCAEKTYSVCKYLDRLPASDADFLWSTSPTKGVFRAADLPTRQALSSEQIPFAIDVFRSDPVGVIMSAARDFFSELFAIKLSAYQADLTDFAATLPPFYFDTMARSRIAMDEGLLRDLTTLYASTYFISLFALSLTAVICFWPKLQEKLHISLQRKWGRILILVALATIGNAAICGILSGPAARYQTRIAWIPLFIMGAIGADVLRIQNAKELIRAGAPAPMK
jgi:hypothetical protein